MSEVRDKFGINFQPVILTFEGENMGRIEKLAGIADEQLKPLVAQGMLRSFDSLYSYLPPAVRQEKNMAQMRDLANRVDPAEVESEFLLALRENGFQTKQFVTYAADVREALEDPQILTISHILGMEELYGFFSRYLSFKGDGSIRLAFYLYPMDKPIKPTTLEALSRIADDLSGQAEREVHLAGIPILTQELKRLTRSGYAMVSLLALALVVIIITIHFRSLGRAMLVLMPLVLAVIWLTGLMALFKVQLNIMNVGVTPMILGIGIDYTVYAMHHYFQTPGISLPGVFRTSGKALVLGTLTTIVGFGSLVTAEHPGLSSMGALATLGVCLCLLATICFLPAMITLGEKIRPGRRAG